jgi:acetyl esterase
MVYVDSEVARLLAAVDPAARDFTTLTPEQLRANAELTVEDMRPAIDLHQVRELRVPTRAGEVAARLYRPHERPGLPLLVFCHGGGWELGSLDLPDRMLRRLARDASVAVLSIDYRLTPEHPFPAGLHDCYDATVWAASHATELGTSSWLAVGGDSAGANLAAAVAQLARDVDGPHIDHQLLVYPVVSRDFSSPSYETFAEGYFLTRAAMEHYWTIYVGEGRPRYADLMTDTSLAGLPPATILTCSLDPLASEGESYANALDRAGVPTELLRFGGLIHGIWYRDGVSVAAHRFGLALAGALRRAAGHDDH